MEASKAGKGGLASLAALVIVPGCLAALLVIFAVAWESELQLPLWRRTMKLLQIGEACWINEEAIMALYRNFTLVLLDGRLYHIEEGFRAEVFMKLTGRT